MIAMKEFLSGVYAEFETTIAKESDMVPLDGLVGVPRGGELVLRFTRSEE